MLTSIILGITLFFFVAYMSIILFEKSVKKIGHRSQMSKLEDQHENLRK